MPLLRRAWWMFLLAMLWIGMAMPATASVRAWLDRDAVPLGQSVTLNIETDQGTVRAPDYTPLQRDFRLSGQTSSRRFQTVNGVTRTQVLFAVALEPKAVGRYTLSALRVGRERTAPLALQVTDNTAVTPAPQRAGESVFIEAQTDTNRAYVQQAVSHVVRLYYATQLISGQLEQPGPDGGTMQQIGQDREYTALVGGTRYNVVERRYLLIPERSGALAIPAARFRGQGVGNFLDDLFGDGRRALDATGPERTVQVLPPPANAPQPWLPLNELAITYLDTPQQAQAGAAANVVVELTADGATATQLPQLELQAGDGAQVFPDPPQVEESVRSGRPQVRITRRFSIVPARAGSLQVQGPRIAWWDVRSGQARTASAPPLGLTVTAAADGSGADAEADSGFGLLTPAEAGSIDAVRWRMQPWAVVAAALLLLWLATLWWGLQRRRVPVFAPTTPATVSAPPVPARVSLQTFLAAVDQGDLHQAQQLLQRMSPVPAPDLDAVREQLIDPAQRDAVSRLQQARWGLGDAAAAAQALHGAFAAGPHWRAPATTATRNELPPLYPP